MDFPETKRSKFSKKQRLELFVKHEGRCYLCGMTIRPGEDWDVEHVLPVGLGGDNSQENLRPAHASRECHKAKTKVDVNMMRKADRIKAKHFGAARPKGSIAGSKKSGWKRKLDGTVVRRNGASDENDYET